MLDFLFLMTVLRCECASAHGDEVIHSKKSEEKVLVLFSTSFEKPFFLFLENRGCSFMGFTIPFIGAKTWLLSSDLIPAF